MVDTEAGYDCPAYSTYLNTTFMDGTTRRTQPNGICRHTQVHSGTSVLLTFTQASLRQTPAIPSRGIPGQAIRALPRTLRSRFGLWQRLGITTT